MAGGKIYHLVGAELVAMEETAYNAEEILQRLLADHPDLLAGDQISPDAPRRWLLIAREAGIPDAPLAADRFSIDHLFVDQDGIPTLVEVKRSSDTRIRREVVGQMLDYAANLVVHWPPERLRDTHRHRFGGDAEAADAEISGFLRLPKDVTSADPAEHLATIADRFWDGVAQNLAAKRLRLLFVADVIPAELQRIIEYLNENMARSEVLGIEVRQYTGGGHTTLVPRVVGRTAAAEDVKSTARPRSERREWDTASFVADSAEVGGPMIADVAARLVDWMRGRGTSPRFGHGAGGPMYVSVVMSGSASVGAFDLSTRGRIEVLFNTLREVRPFDQAALRHQLKDRLNAIPGVAIADEAAERGTWPSFDARLLVPSESFAAFVATLDWLGDQPGG